VDHVCCTTGGQVRRAGLRAVRFVEHESEANYLCVVKVEKPWGLRSWLRTN